MSEVMPPADSVYGFVTCRVIRRTADGSDSDDYPNAIAATGDISFKPVKSVETVTDPSAIAVRETIVSSLDSEGRLVSPGNSALKGVWLLTGVYTVSFALGSGVSLPSMQVEVLATHTTENPLDLVTAVSYTPPTGVTVETLVIPSTVTTGQVLMLDDTHTLVGVPFAALDVDAAADAAASASSAATSESNAITAASNAATSASSAATSESQAATSAGVAQAAASTASTARDQAQEARSGAESAAASAGAARDQAATSATTLNTWFLRGSGSPLGVVTPASAGVQYVDTAQTCGARVWLSTGTTSSAWTVVDGDTGIRRLESLVAADNGVTAQWLCVRRLPDRVEWYVYVVLAAGLAANQTVVLLANPLPPGFGNISDHGAFDSRLNVVGSDRTVYFFNRTFSSGSANPKVWNFGAILSGSTKLEGRVQNPIKGNWPTTLPGTPA